MQKTISIRKERQTMIDLKAAKGLENNVVKMEQVGCLPHTC